MNGGVGERKNTVGVKNCNLVAKIGNEWNGRIYRIMECFIFHLFSLIMIVQIEKKQCLVGVEASHQRQFNLLVTPRGWNQLDLKRIDYNIDLKPIFVLTNVGCIVTKWE
jgi:hypothetical protein